LGTFCVVIINHVNWILLINKTIIIRDERREGIKKQRGEKESLKSSIMPSRVPP
jgi:hypothetical protein